VDMMRIEYYKLGAKFCRHQYKNGSACIFVNESIDFDSISIHHICKEKDLEICAVKLNLPKIKVVTITTYRSSTGNYNYFLRKLDSFINSLYTKELEFIICGDININYLHCYNRRKQLDTQLPTYNVKSTVNFPMRIINGCSTAIDSIIIDLSRNFTINPLINGLSDHSGQLLKLENIIVPIQEFTSYYVRNINSSTIYKFQ